ncbi:MAG: hypothetical protein ACM3X0_03580 [Bacteroidota bacterium]
MDEKTELLAAIEARFPHISAKLRVFWGHPEFVAYINSLFIDTRGGTRQGFPKEIALALWKLHQAHDREFRHLAEDAASSWVPSRRS